MDIFRYVEPNHSANMASQNRKYENATTVSITQEGLFKTRPSNIHVVGTKLQQLNYLWMCRDGLLIARWIRNPEVPLRIHGSLGT